MGVNNAHTSMEMRLEEILSRIHGNAGECRESEAPKAQIMSKAKIFIIFVIVDLAIVGACVWSVFQHIPVRQFLFPAFVLLTLNGLWLIWMILRITPPRQ